MDVFSNPMGMVPGGFGKLWGTQFPLISRHLHFVMFTIPPLRKQLWGSHENVNKYRCVIHFSRVTYDAVQPSLHQFEAICVPMFASYLLNFDVAVQVLKMSAWVDRFTRCVGLPKSL